MNKFFRSVATGRPDRSARYFVTDAIADLGSLAA
jgi:hypothetical protein